MKEQRIEIVARAIYRHLMDYDYDMFPWTDEIAPSNETEEESRDLAKVAVDALDENYRTDDERFEQAVYDASIKRLQELVAKLNMDRPN
jgi:hypothetical protein